MATPTKNKRFYDKDFYADINVVEYPPPDHDKNYYHGKRENMMAHILYPFEYRDSEKLTDFTNGKNSNNQNRFSWYLTTNGYAQPHWGLPAGDGYKRDSSHKINQIFPVTLNNYTNGAANYFRIWGFLGKNVRFIQLPTQSPWGPGHPGTGGLIFYCGDNEDNNWHGSDPANPSVGTGASGWLSRSAVYAPNAATPVDPQGSSTLPYDPLISPRYDTGSQAPIDTIGRRFFHRDALHWASNGDTDLVFRLWDNTCKWDDVSKSARLPGTGASMNRLDDLGPTKLGHIRDYTISPIWNFQNTSMPHRHRLSWLCLGKGDHSSTHKPLKIYNEILHQDLGVTHTKYIEGFWPDKFNYWIPDMYRDSIPTDQTFDNAHGQMVWTLPTYTNNFRIFNSVWQKSWFENDVTHDGLGAPNCLSIRKVYYTVTENTVNPVADSVSGKYDLTPTFKINSYYVHYLGQQYYNRNDTVEGYIFKDEAFTYSKNKLPLNAASFPPPDPNTFNAAIPQTVNNLATEFYQRSTNDYLKAGAYGIWSTSRSSLSTDTPPRISAEENHDSGMNFQPAIANVNKLAEWFEFEVTTTLTTPHDSRRKLENHSSHAAPPGTTRTSEGFIYRIFRGPYTPNPGKNRYWNGSDGQHPQFIDFIQVTWYNSNSNKIAQTKPYRAIGALEGSLSPSTISGNTSTTRTTNMVVTTNQLSNSSINHYSIPHSFVLGGLAYMETIPQDLVGPAMNSNTFKLKINGGVKFFNGVYIGSKIVYTPDPTAYSKNGKIIHSPMPIGNSPSPTVFTSAEIEFNTPTNSNWTSSSSNPKKVLPWKGGTVMYTIDIQVYMMKLYRKGEPNTTLPKTVDENFNPNRTPYGSFHGLDSRSVDSQDVIMTPYTINVHYPVRFRTNTYLRSVKISDPYDSSAPVAVTLADTSTGSNVTGTGVGKLYDNTFNKITLNKFTLSTTGLGFWESNTPIKYEIKQKLTGGTTTILATDVTTLSKMENDSINAFKTRLDLNLTQSTTSDLIINLEYNPNVTPTPLLGTRKETYTISLFHPNYQRLESLTLSEGTIAPSFAPTTTTPYTVTIKRNITSINLTSRTTHGSSYGSVYAEGGSLTGPELLGQDTATKVSIGSTANPSPIKIHVKNGTAFSSNTVQTYTLNIVREPNTLTGLVMPYAHQGTITPPSPGSNTYQATIKRDITHISLTSTTTYGSNYGSVYAESTQLNSTTAVSIHVGTKPSPDPITILVKNGTAHSSYTAQTYTLNIVREPTTNNTLKSLKFTNISGENTLHTTEILSNELKYPVNLKTNLSKIKIIAVPSVRSSTIEVKDGVKTINNLSPPPSQPWTEDFTKTFTGEITLGNYFISKPITIIVKSDDPAAAPQLDYTINITKIPTSGSFFKNLPIMNQHNNMVEVEFIQAVSAKSLSNVDLSNNNFILKLAPSSHLTFQDDSLPTKPYRIDKVSTTKYKLYFTLSQNSIPSGQERIEILPSTNNPIYFIMPVLPHIKLETNTIDTNLTSINLINQLKSTPPFIETITPSYDESKKKLTFKVKFSKTVKINKSVQLPFTIGTLNTPYYATIEENLSKKTIHFEFDNSSTRVNGIVALIPGYLKSQDIITDRDGNKIIGIIPEIKESLTIPGANLTQTIDIKTSASDSSSLIKDKITFTVTFSNPVKISSPDLEIAQNAEAITAAENTIKENINIQFKLDPNSTIYNAKAKDISISSVSNKITFEGYVPLGVSGTISLVDPNPLVIMNDVTIQDTSSLTYITSHTPITISSILSGNLIIDTIKPTITRVEHMTHDNSDETRLDVTFSEEIKELKPDQYSIRYH